MSLTPLMHIISSKFRVESSHCTLSTVHTSLRECAEESRGKDCTESEICSDCHTRRGKAVVQVGGFSKVEGEKKVEDIDTGM